uniref:RNA helicase n=2 Tax=Tetranychus urticae TaxID=32264 RepID=T1KU76_TETUR
MEANRNASTSAGSIQLSPIRHNNHGRSCNSNFQFDVTNVSYGSTLRAYYPSCKQQPSTFQTKKPHSSTYDLAKLKREKENRERENDEILDNIMRNLEARKRSLNTDIVGLEGCKKVKFNTMASVPDLNSQPKSRMGAVSKIKLEDSSTYTMRKKEDTANCSKYFGIKTDQENLRKPPGFLEKLDRFNIRDENLPIKPEFNFTLPPQMKSEKKYQQVKPESKAGKMKVDKIFPNSVTKGENEDVKNIDLYVKDLNFDQDLEEDEESWKMKAKNDTKTTLDVKPLTHKQTDKPDLDFLDLEMKDDLFLKDETEDVKPEAKFFDVYSTIDMRPMKRISVEIADHDLPRETVSIEKIPDKFRSIFSDFPRFNLAQSKVFPDAFNSDKTMVISAPTGSGKTAIFELAITRLLYLADTKQINASFRVVYIAPLKTLCHERYLDWQRKFSNLGLSCVEMTGDSEDIHYRLLENSSLIFATPEKWDTLVRFNSFNKIVQSIKLILIDEVHLLGDQNRGPKLEAIVTRFKIIKKDSFDYRFIAVSATTPNSQDIAQWLGLEEHGAVCYNLDDRFRSVKLTKKVYGYGYPDSVNDFVFLQKLNYKLPPLIKEYSKGRPTLIFVCTRKDSQGTAEFLAKDSSYCYKPEQKNAAFMLVKSIDDSRLKTTLLNGVGFHHAGLSSSDRHKLEVAFLDGNIPVLVATSTLAMGVNFPAHLVIIKGTGHYMNGGFVEYNESDILQMMGRAGRPQFDTNGCAIIMTKGKNESKYKKLVSGEKIIESNIHQFLPEIFMAEIERNTISSLNQAFEWVQSTFFHIRVHENKQNYGFDPNWSEERVEQKIKDICIKELNGLKKYGLIEILDEGVVKATEIGRMMAIKSISYQTMCNFLELKGTESLRDLLTVLAKCRDLNQDVTIRNNEKKHLNLFNARSKTEPGRTIRFPLTGRIKTKEMKINVLLQATLSCLPFPKDCSLHQETGNLIKVAQRLSRCLVDVAFIKAKSLKFLLNCVILAKCLRAGIWENSKFVSKQLPRIGLELSNRMRAGGLTSFREIEVADPRNIEMFCGRKVPFGEMVIKEVKRIPKYNITVERHYKTSKVGYPEAISIKIYLVNWKTLAEDSQRLENHSCALLIGDQNNKILEKRKLFDKILIKSNGVYEKILPVSVTLGSIFIHLIDEFYSGTDISIEYLPKYLLADEREVVRRIPTINHCDNVFNFPQQQGKKQNAQKACEEIEVTDEEEEEAVGEPFIGDANLAVNLNN